MSKRILVIDDEALILEVVQSCLETLSDWQILTALGGAAGVAIAQSEQPDAILLDISMPGMDGIEVVKQLQAHPKTQAIPVVFLTARQQGMAESDWTQPGVVGTIAKPFEPLALVEQIVQQFGFPPSTTRTMSD